MKQLFLLASVAGIALSGCVKDEAAKSPDAQQKITFETPIVAKNTRAPIDGNTYPTEEKFMVTAWYYSQSTPYDALTDKDNLPKYMDDVEVTYNSNNNYWSSQPDYYWPKGYYLAFAAYSPSSVSQLDPTFSHTGDGKGWTIKNFEVEEKPADQIDLLYSDLAKDKTASSHDNPNNNYTGVEILFRHALSQIRFKARLRDTYSGVTIKLTDIKIKNAYDKANFAQNGIDEDANVAWSDYDGAANYTVLSTGEEITTTEAKDVGIPALLLPQEYMHENNTKVNFEVTYTIQYTSGEPIAITQEIDLSDLEYYKEDQKYDPAQEKWEPNHRYTYTLIIGLDKIYFAPYVEDWIDITADAEL